MDIKNTLLDLAAISGVAGNEFEVSKYALCELKKYCEDTEIDSFGNVSAFFKKPDLNKKTILLDAHIDEIGLIVTFIEESGFIRVGACGGVDARQLAAQTVTIWGKEKIKGIVSVLPPHVKKDDENKAQKISEIAIDTGFTKDELKEKISLGDRITVDSDSCLLLNGRVSSKAIDDRSGVISVLYALSLIEKKETKYNIAVSFSVQEEVGCRGAIMQGYKINSDFAIAVDVSFALSPDCKPVKCGKMSAGVMIGFAPSLDREMSEKFVTLAEEKGVAFQKEIMSGKTGTDADEIGVSRGGVRTGLLSIPEKYMHSSVEMVDIFDIESTGKLIAEFLTEGL